jgi:HlyD family secretion protein
MNMPTLKPLLLVALSPLMACTEQGPESMVGTLERDRVELKVESNEPITEIAVSDGQSVAKGELVLQQSTDRLKAQLQQQSAIRDQAAARLAELQRGPRQEAIRESQARLAASEAITRNARDDLDRAKDIFERGLSNQASLDNAQTIWETSTAKEKADRESLASLLSGTTIEELQQAQAALDAAEAGVSLAQLNLSRLTLTTPSAGVIDKVLFETGERPSPGTTVAVLLDHRAFARIYVPEHLKAQLSPGSSLQIRVDGSDREFRGTMAWMSSDAAFTPYFALTEHDRSRLSFLAEVEFDGAQDLPSGIPLEAFLPGNVE